MDRNAFDRLSRLVGTRRGLSLALGAVTLLGIADGAARKRGRKKKSCKHFRVKVTCRDRCGTLHNPNSCSRRKRCRCQSGKTCLANTSCGLTCGADTDCPAESGCTCSTGDPGVCLAAFTFCDDVPTTCETTADCPLRSFCEHTDCGAGGTNEKRCVPLCGYAVDPQQASP